MAAARSPINVTAATPLVSATQHSPWHSPVPYLFGGLAAMLGLIAFALLILACSYWKLSGYLDNESNQDQQPDLEAGDGDKQQQQHGGDYEEKILVIMAGEVKPTFLATKMFASSSRSSSFGDSNSTRSCSCSQNDEKFAENGTVKQGSSDREQNGRLDTV